ncbi:MAG: hypothetical protein KAI29_17895 [Cyclobacteriaceae bacterium]|nr:hypothetical protein [Cyclobacteriaceae bacterium]
MASPLVEKLQNAVKDFSTLEVATLTKSDQTAIPIDLSADDESTDALFKKIRTGLGSKELIGYVKFEADGDTIAFINNDPTYSDVLEYHKDMIKAGQETRKNIYDTIVGLFKKGG